MEGDSSGCDPRLGRGLPNVLGVVSLEMPPAFSALSLTAFLTFLRREHGLPPSNSSVTPCHPPTEHSPCARWPTAASQATETQGPELPGAPGPRFSPSHTRAGLCSCLGLVRASCLCPSPGSRALTAPQGSTPEPQVSLKVSGDVLVTRLPPP